MKFIFKQTDQEGKKYTVYKINPDGREKYKSINLTNKTSNRLRSARICQLVAEGKTISNICGAFWAPEEVEFYIWVQNSKEIAGWYREAQKIRSKNMLEKVYQQIEDAPLESKDDIKPFTDLIKKLTDAIKEEENSGVKTYVNTTVLVPENMKTWYVTDEDRDS